MKKRVVCLLMAVVMALSLLPATVLAATSISGSCGKNLTWTLDRSGTLTIKGRGAMADFSDGKQPWSPYKNRIRALVLSDSVTSVGTCAFMSFPGLNRITLPEGVTSIGGAAFHGCSGLTDVTLPQSLQEIGNWAFSQCTGLKSATIPANLTSIGVSVFGACTSLENVTICSGAKYIGVEQFLNCIRLNHITLPESIERIGIDAFSGCKSLTSIRIPAKVTDIGSNMYAFRGCERLTSIEVAAENKVYTSRDGILFSKDMTVLYQCPAGRSGGVTIPKGVKELTMNSLACKGLTAVLIPASVAKISTDAFSGCDSLKNVYFSGSQAQWNAISISRCNEPLESASFRFNYQGTLLPAAVKKDFLSVSGKPYLKWDAVSGATVYEIYRCGSKNGVYQCIGTTAKTNYTDTSAYAGYIYYYKIKALGANGAASDYSSVVSCVCHCAKPTVKTDYLSSTGKPYLKWSSVSGAAKYEVYRATSENGTYTLLGTTAKTNFTDSKATVGKTYYYKVKVISKVRSSANSVFSTVVSATCHCARPTVKSIDGRSNPSMSWAAVDGAAKYEVYRATSENGKFTKMFTTNKTSYANTSAKAGNTYYYKVKVIAKAGTKANSSFSAVIRIKAK